MYTEKRGSTLLGLTCRRQPPQWLLRCLEGLLPQLL